MVGFFLEVTMKRSEKIDKELEAEFQREGLDLQKAREKTANLSKREAINAYFNQSKLKC